jgi:hypothetical protein
VAGRRVWWVAALVVAVARAPGYGATARRPVRPGPVTRESVRSSAAEVGQYEKLELTVTLRAAYSNPYDPDQIAVEGRFTAPSGRAVVVPGFHYQGYTRSRSTEDGEVLTPTGRGGFKVRFAWGEVGEYRFTVMARERGKARTVGGGTFTVRASAARGYVRRSTSAPHYFQYDSGASYFAVGENLCWPNEPGTYAYDTWLNRLADAGGNYTRLWLDPHWNELGLEKRAESAGDGNGLGRYDPRASWRVDYLLELARQRNVRVMLALLSFNSVDATGEYGGWADSVYNRANGGPCRQPAEFFTNPTAKRLFKRRLRYLVARWGCSPAVLSWEFWNEVDLATGYNSAQVAAWHAEMADYVRSIDPWQHLLTTSFANTEGDPAVEALPQLDYVQSHSYGSHDVAGTIGQVTTQKLAACDRPHYFGEFGIDAYPDSYRYDPDGIHLHNGLWSAALSGSAGTAMTWWWDNYVEPRNLYYHFARIAAFVADVDWVRENYQPGRVVSVEFAAGVTPKYSPLTLSPVGESWEDGSVYNQPHTYRIGNDGRVSGIETMGMVQHGVEDHPSWHNPATFLVNYPIAGRFEVVVGGVSGYGGAGLRITRDGTEALRVSFPDTQPRDHEDLHQYDRAYGIDVPAGAHTVGVENPGVDWCYVSYRLTDYLTAPNLRVMALANETSALLWLQNRESTWWTRRNGGTPPPLPACVVMLEGFSPGEYDLERWDTQAGTPVGTTRLTCAEGRVALTSPSNLVTDVAYKLRKVE